MPLYFFLSLWPSYSYSLWFFFPAQTSVLSTSPHPCSCPTTNRKAVMCFFYNWAWRLTKVLKLWVAQTTLCVVVMLEQLVHHQLLDYPLANNCMSVKACLEISAIRNVRATASRVIVQWKMAFVWLRTAMVPLGQAESWPFLRLFENGVRNLCTCKRLRTIAAVLYCIAENFRQEFNSVAFVKAIFWLN